MIEDTGAVQTLADLTKQAQEKPAGTGATPVTPPSPTAPLYKLTAPCFLHGRLWEVGEKVRYEGKPNPAMVLVPDAPAADPEAAAEVKPSKSKGVKPEASVRPNDQEII